MMRVICRAAIRNLDKADEAIRDTLSGKHRYNDDMPDPATDPLSSLAHEIIKAATYEKLVAPSNTPATSRDLLGAVSADRLLTIPITNRPAAMAMLAGLWLWHDGLSECHEIAQKSPEDLERAAHHQLQEMTETLSFWHASLQSA
jgi:hypothetical protein